MDVGIDREDFVTHRINITGDSGVHASPKGDEIILIDLQGSSLSAARDDGVGLVFNVHDSSTRTRPGGHSEYGFIVEGYRKRDHSKEESQKHGQDECKFDQHTTLLGLSELRCRSQFASFDGMVHNKDPRA